MPAVSKLQNHVSNVVANNQQLIERALEQQSLYTESLLLGYISRNAQTGVINCNLPDEAFAGDNSFLTAADFATGLQGLAALNDAMTANSGAILSQILKLKR